ncbi:outer membrane beta-barrel protein [Subsaximicrobium wynnwilliamsii]|nr:outer membrane beta-barrel protein [Subsaximicrobium wynnwilliamsii]
MKKLILVAVVAVFGLANVNAQNFNAGISAGLPIGDFSDLYSFSVIVDVNYLWEVSEQFDAGVTVGYSHSFGKDEDLNLDLGDFGSFDIETEDFGYIPIGAAGRFNASEDFTIGLDLGYAIAVSPSGSDGGFYYAPKVQYGITQSLDIVAAYRGVSLDGGSFDIVSLGIEFGL